MSQRSSAGEQSPLVALMKSGKTVRKHQIIEAMAIHTGRGIKIGEASKEMSDAMSMGLMTHVSQGIARFNPSHPLMEQTIKEFEAEWAKDDKQGHEGELYDFAAGRKARQSY
jgi:hypothetical protein